MIFKKIPSWAAVVLMLAVIVVVALWLRVVLPYSQVFVKDWVKMTGVDAYYYMRLVDNLAAHFPHLTQFDPYFKYPGGWETGASPDFFAYFMGAIIWLLSLGKAGQHTVDVIAVFIPPVLAVLIILAAFIIGRVLDGKWMGLLAAGLLAVIPGEFLNRSLLGYTDHHIAEVLFSSGLMMFVFLAVKEGEGKRLDEMLRGGWKGIGRPVIYGLLGGMFLWLYMLTWAGALLFTLIIFIFIVAQAVLDHLHGRPLDYLGILGACVFGTSLALYLPWMGDLLSVASLAIGLLVSLLLPAVSGVFNKRKMGPWTFPLAILGMGIVAVAALAITSPALLQSMLGGLSNIFVWHPGTTVMEEQPLLIQQGNFTFAVATGNYMLSFFLSLICLMVLFYQVIKKGQPDKTLLLVWSLVILLSALAMRRFAYYYAVNVALLTGYLCWVPVNLLLQKKAMAAALPLNRKATARSKRKAAQQQSRPKVSRNSGLIAILLAAIVLLVYYPNIGPLPDGQKPAIDLATRPLFAPSNAWCETADWLRANTPEPFGDPEAYYGLYKPVTEKGGFEYPSSVYGILSWWDYGYWITRVGRRVPVTNPGTGPSGTASFFTAQDGTAAAPMLSKLGTRYVIVDNEIASYDGKFHALASLSGSSYSQFYDVFLQKQDNKYASAILFFPEYYRSMVIRLYNFDGKAVVPAAVNVIACRDITTQDGRSYKEIIETKTFNSYDEAQGFVLANKSKDYILVGQDPYKSPVPLDELKGYKLVYASNQKVTTGSQPQSNIKIFEYQEEVH